MACKSCFLKCKHTKFIGNVVDIIRILSNECDEVTSNILCAALDLRHQEFSRSKEKEPVTRLIPV